MLETANLFPADSAKAAMADTIIEPGIDGVIARTPNDVSHKIFLPPRPGASLFGPREYYYPASRTGVVPSWAIPATTSRIGVANLVREGLCAETSARRPAMKVKDAMHKGVDWVHPDTPITALAKLMREHDIGAIPIGENDHLVGMVTDRDIVCKGVAQDGFAGHRVTARDVMTPGIHCCREDDDLAKAVRHMESLKVRRLPVINKGKRMVGIPSLGGISHAASTDLLSECVKTVSAHHH
jgi:CBS domain-containing protein